MLAEPGEAMLASLPMTGRLLLVSCLSLWAIGCTSHAPATVAVDTPLVPYVAPDVDELTAGDEFLVDEDEPEEATEEPAPAAPQPATKTPAAPAKSGK